MSSIKAFIERLLAEGGEQSKWGDKQQALAYPIAPQPMIPIPSAEFLSRLRIPVTESQPCIIPCKP